LGLIAACKAFEDREHINDLLSHRTATRTSMPPIALWSAIGRMRRLMCMN